MLILLAASVGQCCFANNNDKLNTPNLARTGSQMVATNIINLTRQQPGCTRPCQPSYSRYDTQKCSVAGTDRDDSGNGSLVATQVILILQAKGRAGGASANRGTTVFIGSRSLLHPTTFACFPDK
jgi:hypothetical protein